MADTKSEHNGASKLLGGVDSEATGRLKSAAAELAAAEGQRLLMGLGRKLGSTTGKLNDVAEGRSPGLAKLALDSGRKAVEGKGPVRGALEIGASRVKDKAVEGIKGVFGGGKKRKKGAAQKPTVILEYVDVGVPVRDAYDQWTQFQDFSSFAKGVKDVTVADDTSSDWKLKVFWSNRSWKAHTTEQLPDRRISWTSEGAKGTTKGVVTFHELTETLTRVVLVMEYFPKGLFEKTGNIWRAQGRRARLDLKHYARHISLKGEAEDGWRGEIREGEVVRSHEDAIAEENDEQQEENGEDTEAEARTGDEGEEEPEPEGVDEEAQDDVGTYDDEAAEPEAYDEEEDSDAYEDEPAEDAEEDSYESGDEEAGEESEEDDEDTYEDEAEDGPEAEADDDEPEEEYAEAGERR